MFQFLTSLKYTSEEAFEGRETARSKICFFSLCLCLLVVSVIFLCFVCFYCCNFFYLFFVSCSLFIFVRFCLPFFPSISLASATAAQSSFAQSKCTIAVREQLTRNGPSSSMYGQVVLIGDGSTCIFFNAKNSLSHNELFILSFFVPNKKI